MQIWTKRGGENVGSISCGQKKIWTVRCVFWISDGPKTCVRMGDFFFRFLREKKSCMVRCVFVGFPTDQKRASEWMHFFFQFLQKKEICMVRCVFVDLDADKKRASEWVHLFFSFLGKTNMCMVGCDLVGKWVAQKRACEW